MDTVSSVSLHNRSERRSGVTYKERLAAVLAMVCVVVGCGEAPKPEPHPDWENPQMIGRNKDAPRATRWWVIRRSLPGTGLSTASGASTGPRTRPRDRLISSTRSMTSAPGISSRSPPTGSCTAMATRSTQTSAIPGVNPTRRVCPMTSTRWVPTGGHSRCPRPGTAARSTSVSAA